MNKSMTVMTAAAILLPSSAFAQTVDTKADCNKAVEVWRTAYNKRDAGALANLYDAKAGMYSTPWWTATGHDALLAGFEAEMNFAATITSIVCDHSSMIGATATNVSDGTWTGTMKGPDGKDLSAQGHWMSVSETRDGKTLVHVTNMQMPQAPAMR
jgi:ketosteroid isomerase-like protein